jgi:hypothetical protein
VRHPGRLLEVAFDAFVEFAGHPQERAPHLLLFVGEPGFVAHALIITRRAGFAGILGKVLERSTKIGYHRRRITTTAHL